MIETVTGYAGIVIYIFMAILALWGLYCVVMVWVRVGQKRFKSESQQEQYIDAITQPMSEGNFEIAAEIGSGDPRAICQLATLAIENRNIGYKRVRQLVADRFQRDVLSDIEFRLSWVNTVIKSAPMVGLLGTVIGMMGAFAKLATSEDVDPMALAGDIQFALITTACGLAIAIPLVLCIASITNRIKKMEDDVAIGLNSFFELLKGFVGK